MAKNYNKLEFSKLLVGGITISYYIGMIYSMVFIKYLAGVSPEIAEAAYDKWLIFMGIPFPTVIGFYLWKSKCENIPKIIKGWLDSTKDPELRSILINSLKTGNISKLDPMASNLAQSFEQLGNINPVNTEPNINPIITDPNLNCYDQNNQVNLNESIDTNQISEMVNEDNPYTLNSILDKYGGCK